MILLFEFGTRRSSTKSTDFRCFDLSSKAFKTNVTRLQMVCKSLTTYFIYLVFTGIIISYALSQWSSFIWASTSEHLVLWNTVMCCVFMNTFGGNNERHFYSCKLSFGTLVHVIFCCKRNMIKLHLYLCKILWGWSIVLHVLTNQNYFTADWSHVISEPVFLSKLKEKPAQNAGD